jgi:hypothetical protein
MKNHHDAKSFHSIRADYFPLSPPRPNIQKLLFLEEGAQFDENISLVAFLGEKAVFGED